MRQIVLFPRYKKIATSVCRLHLFLLCLCITYSVVDVLYAQATIDLSKPVGSPKGGMTASGSGGVRYSIPIEVLPGTKGLQPNISLEYNSRGGDGNFGWGWNLSALSAITRAGKSNYYNGTTAPVSYSNTDDAFLLDGQHLFVTSGTNGSNGSVYGTENESFNKIESFGGNGGSGPSWFRVTTKTGVIMEYGNATDALVTTDNYYSNMVWLLNKVTDINGNYEIFHYGINNADRDFALSEIDYTGNAVQGIQPYNKILFTYDVKPNWQTQKSFSGGASLTTPFLLNSVSVVNSAGTTVRKYQCAYLSQRNQYFLQKVTETGADGTTSLNPLLFSYGSNLIASDVAVSPQYPAFNLNNTFTGDMTGDGKQDLAVGYYKYDNNGWPYYTNYEVYYDFTQYAGSGGMARAYTCPVAPSSGETQIKSASNYYNFLTSDYDGDSKQDMLRINWATSGSDLLFSNVIINYSRYSYAGTSPTSSYVSQTYSSIPHVSGYSQDFRYAYHSGGVYGTNFIPGDFDGDGAQDYILVLGINNSNSFKGFFSSPLKGIFNQEIATFGVEGTSSDPFYANSIASATDVVPIDFNGDGKTELLVQKTNYSYVISVSPVSAASGYSYAAATLASTGAIKIGYRVYPGDFNGDGNTDLLVRSAKDDPTAAWNLLYSDGKSSFSSPYPFVFQNRPYLENDQGGNNAHLLMIADLNGDGKSDVWHSLDVNTSGTITSKHTLYYSSGVPMPNQNSTTSFTVESYTNSTSINKAPTTNTPVGDMNGDGKPDMFSLNTSGSRIIYAKPFKEERLMTKITDGMGGISGCYYEVTTNHSYVYTRSDAYTYDNQSTAIGQGLNGNPYMVVTTPMYVMYYSYMPNGNGSTRSTGYQYQDAAVSSTRGFLGFKQIIATDNGSGIARTTYTDIDPNLLVPHTIRQTSSYLGTILSDTKITDAMTRVISNYFDKRYTYHIIKTLTTDGLSGASVESNNSYDSYNNITDNVVNKGYMSGSSITAVETTRTATAFGTHGTPVPASPESISLFSTRTGQSTVSKQTNYTYDSKNNVLTLKDWDGTPLLTTVTYTYDGFGNMVTQSVSAPGTPTPVITNTYDNTGRFLTKKETAGSGITKRETYTYETTWGMPASTVSSDGLTTNHTYDNTFGKLIKTTLPDGNAINQNVAWETSGNARYSVTTQRAADGGGQSKTYYDILDRKIKTETSGFNSQNLTTTTTYNSSGRVTTETAPYYSGESVITTTTSYDGYGRITKVDNGTSSITSAYTQLPGGQYQVTTTNAVGQAGSKTTDAAGRIISSGDNGGQLGYTYDSWGNQLSSQIGGNTVVSNVYDAYGRKTSMTDKNAGTINYEYNASGKLTKQTDALNQVHTVAYDAFGRRTSQTGPEGTTNYTYFYDGNTGYNNDKIAQIAGFAGETTTNTYDNLARLTSTSVLIDGTTYIKTFAYDGYSNLITTTYPSGVVINNTYDKNGIVIKVTLGAGSSPTTLFTATSMNSRGIYTGYTYGNGKTSTVTYDLAKNAPARYYTAGIQDLNLNFDGQTGNLLSRNDGINAITEAFTYDNLNRLTSSTVNNVTQFSMSYDASGSTSLGNVISKSDIGNYTYDNTQINAVRFIASTSGGTTPPGVISQSTQDIAYTPFLKVATVTETVPADNYAAYSLAYTYGQDQQRIKSVLQRNGSTVETKYYLGMYERQIYNGVMRDLHYITVGGHLCAIVVRQGAAVTPYFVYTDHLGSILTVTDASGTAVAQQNFDAWGRKRNPVNWTYSGVPAVPDWLYRGFTGHEYLAPFALINMNGRVYDPTIGRMLSPDNYVEHPSFTQSYNRFSYCINNPLKYTDPSGELFGIDDWIVSAVGFVVGYVSYGLETHHWGGKALLSGLAGAVIAEVSYLTLGGGGGLFGSQGVFSAVNGGSTVSALSFSGSYALSDAFTIAQNSSQIQQASGWGAFGLIAGYSAIAGVSAGFSSGNEGGIASKIDKGLGLGNSFLATSASNAIGASVGGAINSVGNYILQGYNPGTNKWDINLNDFGKNFLSGFISSGAGQLAGNAVGAIGDKVSTNSWGVTLGAFPVKEFVGQVVNQGISNSLNKQPFFRGLFGTANNLNEAGGFWNDLLGIGSAFTLFPLE